MTSTVVSEGLVRYVQLWNDGDGPYDQVINGDRYTIAPKTFVELPRRVAIQIRGQYLGKKPNGDLIATNLRMVQLPEKGRDKERIEQEETSKKEEKVNGVVYACHKCNFESKDKAELTRHMDVHKRVRGKPAQRATVESKV